MPSLFLSHSSADKTFVEKLAKDLEGVGVNVWFDKWEIKVGDSLTGKIEEGLQANDYLAWRYAGYSRRICRTGTAAHRCRRMR